MPNRLKRPAPLSLRLTPEDRQRLEQDAYGMSLGGYIRWRLFDPDNPAPRQRQKSAPAADQRVLAEVLAKLAQSRIASNLNQLAKAANSGSLVLTPEIEAELLEALRHITMIRRDLVHALGLSDGAP